MINILIQTLLGVSLQCMPTLSEKNITYYEIWLSLPCLIRPQLRYLVCGLFSLLPAYRFTVSHHPVPQSIFRFCLEMDDAEQVKHGNNNK